VPEDALELFRRAIPQGEALVDAWNEELAAYERDFPDLAAELRRRLDRRLANGWDAGLKTYDEGTELATRKASQEAIAALPEPVPELFGGSADLSESNLTIIKGGGDFGPVERGRNLWFGVRGGGMG